MSIVFVSTFPPAHCGIGNYTKFLCDSISKASKEKMFVISEGGAPDESLAYVVYNSYKRSEAYDAQIISALESIPSVEIVHFQHAPDLFPKKKMFLGLLKELSTKGYKLFVTLHTVYDNKTDREFYTKISLYAQIIVHNSKCKEIINETSKSVAVIAHGTEMIVSLDSYKNFDESVIRTENDFVFLFLGFIHAQKNLHIASIAFSKLLRKNKFVKFLVVGKPGGDMWYNKLYLGLCKALTLFSDRVLWKTDFVTNEEIHQYLKASDVVLLPYFQSYSSSSGIFHQTIGAGKPFLCSDSPKFSEIKEYIGDLPVFVPANNIKKWTDTMELLSKDRSLLNQISESIKGYADSTSWDNVGSEHVEVYNTKIADER